MSNVLPFSRPSADEDSVYLGHATVEVAEPARLEVALADERIVGARCALAFPYEPAVGDCVLIIGQQGNHYLIGVLSGAGRATLRFPGDVDLRAEGGRLRLSGSSGVDVAAPEVTLQASRLEVIAGSVREHCKTLQRSVTELMSVWAGNAHTFVTGSMHSQAKEATLLTREQITINGETINIG